MLNKDNFEKYYHYDEGLLFVVSGPSGAGKSAVCRQYVKEYPNSFLSISETTRKIRDYEVEGDDYYFIDNALFEKRKDEDYYLECAGKFDNYYGTPKEPILNNLKLGKNVILEIETKGAFQVKEKYPNAILIFFLPSSMEYLEKQLRDRKTESEEKIQKRLSEVKTEISKIPEYDYVIVNEYGKMDESVELLNDIIVSSRLNVKRILNQDRKDN